MKNKKGIELLGGFTVNIVIAVLCLLVLVYAGYKVFGLFQDKSEIEKASNTLEGLSNEINSLKEGIENETSYLVLNPANWYIKSYLGRIFPDNCNAVSCLCFCNEINCRDLKKCNEFGFEVEVDEQTYEFYEDAFGNTLGIAENTFFISKVPVKLNITKQGEVIRIKEIKENEE